MQTRVKICGITNEKDLKTAIDAGADAVGFIIEVPSSPRNLTIDKAKELVKKVPVFVEAVAVTVPDNLNTVLKIDREISPDIIQVHGEKLDLKTVRKSLSRPKLIKTANMKRGKMNFDLKNIKFFDAVLLDSTAEGKLGGTGIIHNWKTSYQFKKKIYPKPLILAGGLTPENIGEAISVVRPYAVDVSTGVEQRPGVKDANKIYQFIRKVRDVSQ